MYEFKEGLKTNFNQILWYLVMSSCHPVLFSPASLIACKFVSLSIYQLVNLLASQLFSLRACFCMSIPPRMRRVVHCWRDHLLTPQHPPAAYEAACRGLSVKWRREWGEQVGKRIDDEDDLPALCCSSHKPQAQAPSHKFSQPTQRI